MGLLDNFANAPAESGFNDALLAAAQALLTPRARGGGMGAAFGAFPQAQARAQEQAMRQKMFGLQERQLGMQVSEAERKRAESEAAQANRAAFFRQLIERGQFKPDMLPAALQAGIDPKEIELMAKGSRLGLPSLVNVNGVGVDPQTWQPMGAVPDPNKPFGTVIGKDGALQTVANQPYQDFAVRKSAAGATSVNVNTGQKDNMWGDAPKGYVWARDPNTGEVMTQADKSGAVAPMAMPIAGSKEDRERKSDAEKASQRQRYAEQVAGTVLSSVREAKAAVGPLSAGFGGSIMGNVPGSSAVNLKALIDPIKANIGFQRLQEMRDMSPTGGALGQVAVQELNMLQSVISSLDQAQSPDQLRRSFDKIERHFNNWARVMAESSGQQAHQPAEAPKRKRFNPATGQLE